MAETIVVCGYGVGISDAVARRFGKEGYRVAAVARNAERLGASVEKLTKDGIDAKAFPCDLGDSNAIQKLIADVRASLGPIKVLHWNAYSGSAGDLKTASTADLRSVLDVAVNGLIAATQASLGDLKAQNRSTTIDRSCRLVPQAVNALPDDVGTTRSRESAGDARRHATSGIFWRRERRARS